MMCCGGYAFRLTAPRACLPWCMGGHARPCAAMSGYGGYERLWRLWAAMGGKGPGTVGNSAHPEACIASSEDRVIYVLECAASLITGRGCSMSIAGMERDGGTILTWCEDGVCLQLMQR